VSLNVLTCLNCGKVESDFEKLDIWKFVELYDSFREPICPDCQKFFRKEEMRKDWQIQVITVMKADFQKRDHKQYYSRCP
jgi:hypothetical protein